MTIEKAQLIVPGRLKATENAAVITAIAIAVDRAVVRHNAGEMRRVEDAHPPLRDRVIRLSDAANLSGAPGLPRDPFDQLVVVLHLSAVVVAELAFGLARTAYIGVHIGVALAHIPFDRSGLALRKNRIRRCEIVAI